MIDAAKLCEENLSRLVFVIVLLIGVSLSMKSFLRWDLYERWNMDKPDDPKVRYPCGSIFICLYVVLGVGIVGLVSPDRSPALEKMDLWTILALVVALGAYTSSILIELRRTIKRCKDDPTACAKDLARHEDDHAWLVPTDLLIAAISLLVILTIILKDVTGCECYTYRLLIDGLFLALIVYFIHLHIRQWLNHLNHT